MEFLKHLEENTYFILWIVIGIILLIVIIPLIKKIRDRKLLQAVTDLNRGTRSERELILKLLKNGIPAQTIFHDLVLEKSDGKFSQIDVVIATTEGIIVIEVKDYSG